MRYRSVANVADEFDFVSREMPEIKTVMLEDDTFIISKPRTLELAKELIRRGNKLPFDANCRADIGAEKRVAHHAAPGWSALILRRLRKRRRGSDQRHEEEQ